MKFTADFRREADMAFLFAGKTSAVSATSNILMALSGNTLTMRATDGTKSFEASISVSGEEDGEVLVPADKLLQILKNVTGEVTVSTDGAKLSIKPTSGRKTKVSVITQDTKHFPEKEEPKEATEVQISAKQLKSMLSSITGTMSENATTEALRGVNLSHSDEGITMVSTDGRAMGFCIEEGEFQPFENITIPSRFIPLLYKALPDEGNVSIGISKSMLSVSFSDIVITTNLINSAYPNWKRIVPKNLPLEFIVNRQDVANAVTVTSIMADKDVKAVDLIFRDPSLTVSASVDAVGESVEELDAIANSKEEVAMRLNAELLMKVLKSIATDTVKFCVDNPHKAFMIYGNNAENVKYVVMPMERR